MACEVTVSLPLAHLRDIGRSVRRIQDNFALGPTRASFSGQEAIMFIFLAIVLAIAWVMGFTVFHVASAAIHVLIIFAIASVVLHFIRGKGASPSV